MSKHVYYQFSMEISFYTSEFIVATRVFPFHTRTKAQGMCQVLGTQAIHQLEDTLYVEGLGMHNQPKILDSISAIIFCLLGGIAVMGNN